jgi:hypothetical protein
MSLELDVVGPTVEKAVDDLIDAGEIAWLLETIGEAPAGTETPDRLRAQVMRPSTLWRLIEAGHLDEDSLGRVIEGMGNAAIAPLLDVLLESEARSLRRRIFDYLIRIGRDAGAAAAQRLDDPRWFVARNILSLMNRVRSVPEGFDVQAYLRHEDARVRREAMSLALSQRSLRDGAIIAGLTDEDERLLRMALGAAQDGLPEEAVPILLDRVVRSDHPPEVRALGVRALRHSRSRLVPEALMALAVSRKTFFGRPKIASPEPDVLAALLILHDHWRDYPDVAPVLKAAGRSREGRVRAAAQGAEAQT